MDSLLSQNANLNNMYQNSGYNFNRTERKTLIIDKAHANNVSEHTADLIEPFIIDKLSDIYLESFTTHDAVIHTDDSVGKNMAFVLSIDELNINSNSNNSHTFNKIIIPNESTSSTGVHVHKSKKLNYICSINPTKLNKLTITITGLDKDEVMFGSNGRYILELIFIARK